MASVVLPLAVGPRIVINEECGMWNEDLFIFSCFVVQRYKKMHNAQCTMHNFL